MAFGFAAVGSKREVIAQCRAHNLDDYASVATEARDLIVRALEDDTSEPHGFRYAYTVKASGHTGGGSPSRLNLTIESEWVPETVTDVPEVVSSPVEEAATP